MGGGNAEPSAKNSVENNWKTLSGLNSSIMSRKYMKAQNRSMIQVLFTDCCADEITLKTMALKLIQNGHLGLGFQHFLELVPSATVQNLQLKTKFTHDYHLFFFFSWPWNSVKIFSDIILKEQVIFTTAKTLENKNSKSVFQEHETELVCWQYTKLLNADSCLIRRIQFSSFIMDMHNGHETGKIVAVLYLSTHQMCALWGLHVSVQQLTLMNQGHMNQEVSHAVIYCLHTLEPSIEN